MDRAVKFRHGLTHLRSKVWPLKAAMHRVWDEYCPYGIETEAQERYLYDLAARVCHRA